MWDPGRTGWSGPGHTQSAAGQTWDLRSRRHLFHPRKRLIYRRNRQHDQSDQRLQPQISPIVSQGIYRGAHSGSLRVGSEENQARQEGEEITAQHTGDIALDEAVLFIAEQAGQAESAEGQQIVGNHLRQADDVGIRDQLQQAVSHARHKTGPQSVSVSDAADEQHGKEGDGSAHGSVKKLQKRGDHGESHGDR